MRVRCFEQAKYGREDDQVGDRTTTGTLLRRGFSWTKDKVVKGKSKVEEDDIILYNCIADSTASVPEGTNPVDVAALVKYYLASLPEPLTTLELYNEIRDDGEAIDASSPIPWDDGMPVDFGAIEVIQLLVEHHNAIFTDANETVWN
ncbi:hypothetical protein VNO80_14515 [Phaseolus coccineus]|uniref:Rho-GAP domain-containing protein n=1 Tax=Phaseolus coccineus TaxID=3886 RepID=A0AAN9R1Y8_PHACN